MVLDIFRGFLGLTATIYDDLEAPGGEQEEIK